MHAQALAITGATGLLRFDTDNTPTKPLEIGQFRGHLVSSLVQLTFDGEADEAGKSRLHKTPVVYVGALFDRIDGIDQKSRTARLSFDLWFRFQGDSPVSDIVFSNAVEPIRMGEPVERVSSKGIEYRRYHVSGRFSLNFDDHRPAADGLIAGLQFTHRTLSYDQLIYVAESGGQAATASSSALATLSETIVPGTDWRINHIYANANIVDRPTLGKPSQVDSGSSSQPFSNFVERVELAPYENSLRRQLTGDTALWAAVAASLALLVCLIIDTGRPKDRSRRRMLTLTVVASGAFLLASEAEIYHLLSIATLEWAQAPLITFFNGLWWVVPASLANMFIDRFIWNKLEEATGHVVPKVIRSFVSAAIYLVAMVGILANVLQKDVTGLIATSGVMAMIIGLALQSNLSNIFSGIVLNLERPFRPGDWIKIGDAPVGRVVDISWRAMQIRAFQNSVISIPNSMVAASRIENFTYPNDYYFVYQTFWFHPECDPERLKMLLTDALLLTNSADNRQRVERMWVRCTGLVELNQGKLALKLVVSCDVNDRDVVNSQEHEVMKNVKRVLDYAGINLCVEPGNRHGPLPCEELLTIAPAFAGLNPATRARIAATALCETYRTGTSILSTGVRPECLFVIAEGVVAVKSKFTQ